MSVPNIEKLSAVPEDNAEHHASPAALQHAEPAAVSNGAAVNTLAAGQPSDTVLVRLVRALIPSVYALLNADMQHMQPSLTFHCRSPVLS
jgi:hypothetical protein